MSEEQLAFYEMVIKADKSHDVNFKNVARELFIEVKELQQKIDKTIEYISFIIKRFEEIEDKELITNRLVDIEIVYKLLDILGDKANE